MMASLLGAIAFDETTEQTQRFTLDAIMNATNLAFFFEFVTGFYSQRPNASNVHDGEVADYRYLVRSAEWRYTSAHARGLRKITIPMDFHGIGSSVPFSDNRFFRVFNTFYFK